jgi:hypothetical protein
MSDAPLPLDYRATAVADLVSSHGPQSLRERYVDALRTARRRRATNRPASARFIARMNGLQHEGLAEVDRLRSVLAPFPAEQVAAVSGLLTDLLGHVNSGHHTTASPAEVNDLWGRVESAVAALAATRPDESGADGPRSDGRTVCHAGRSVVVASATTFRFIEHFWDQTRRRWREAVEFAPLKEHMADGGELAEDDTAYSWSSRANAAVRGLGDGALRWEADGTNRRVRPSVGSQPV